ncbi:MAG TPA: hypothetical protein VHH36_00210 [Candidatus Thermoplasmatota archaeon]|nr:hypothetical protein [Candidatus Thermoplasmatota archaeon]
MRVLLALVLVVGAAAPLAQAHLPFERPYVQAGEGARTVNVTVDGPRARFEMTQDDDPLLDLVRHEMDLARGIVRVEHRRDPPSAGDAIFAEWRLARVVEYRDANRNFLFDAGDTVARAWRPASYAWNVTGPAPARVGDLTVQLVTWNGSAPTGPAIRFQAAAAGRDFTDEGARVRPQDVALYLQMDGFSGRGVGNLYALEAQVVAREGSSAVEETSPNGTFGLHVDLGGRRAYLVWGAQATLDGAETDVAFTLGEATVADGNVTWPAIWHFPLFDRSARMVMVSAVEYPLPTERPSPGMEAGLVGALGALLLAGLARKARR